MKLSHELCVFFKTLRLFIHWKCLQATPSNVLWVWQFNTSPLCSPTEALHRKTMNKPFNVAFSLQILHLQLRQELLLHLTHDREGGKCLGRWWGCDEAGKVSASLPSFSSDLCRSERWFEISSGSVELQCKLRFSHATCLLNEQHTALLLHWWGNRWSEDIPEHAKPYFQRLGLHVWQACCSGSQMNFSFKNRPPIAKRNKSALSPFRVRECFVVVLCGSELRLLPSWVSSFSVFQHGCNTWKHAVWERSKGRREFCSANDSIK